MTTGSSISPPSLPPEPDYSGRQLGDYQLLRRIGRGAMAEVYLAEQTSLGRKVAFKVLKRHLADDASYIKRFQNEARAAASLVHANIVQIYEVGCIDGVHFIALEYVQGQNLKQLLGKSGPLEAPLAVAIMRQVGAALHKAAERGLIHRDIKPENIMLSSLGEVKVADFGLSRSAGDGSVDLTQVGVTMGTPLYMSPEQAEGRTLDPRSDLYSFGVTCYHMLAGRPPFNGETALVVAVQHIRTQPERLENLRPDLPGGLCRVVHKLLAKNADERYQRPSELLAELKSLQIGGADYDWSAGLDDWSAAELIALSDGRLEATQRLGVIMKNSAKQGAKRRNLWWLVLLGAAAAFFVGAMVAWFNREPYLLARQPGEVSPQVERMASAEAQYLHAMALDTDEAYAAVGNYFPQNLIYARRAQQQLARRYLQRYQALSEPYALEQAMEVFQELAKLDSTEVRLRAFGIAGQVIVFDLQGDQRQAAGRLAELVPLIDQLDPDMRTHIDAIRRKLDPASAS